MTNSTNTPGKRFWVIAVLALLWNISGIAAYLGEVYLTVEDLALKSLEEQAFYANEPTWVVVAFAIAVFTGTFGSLALLIRKKWATPLFVMSLLAVLAQFVYTIYLQKDMEITFDKMIWTLVIILIALFLIWFSKKSSSAGYLS